MLGAEAEPALPKLYAAIHADPMSPAWIGVTAIGTNVPSNLLTLISEFRDPVYRNGLIPALAAFTNSPSDCVPILIEGVNDERVVVKCISLSGLKSFGTNAQMAIPYVLSLTTNSDAVVAISARSVLGIIDPSPASNPARD